MRETLRETLRGLGGRLGGGLEERLGGGLGSRLAGGLGGGLQKGHQRGLQTRLGRGLAVRLKSGLVQVWFRSGSVFSLNLILKSLTLKLDNLFYSEARKFQT